MVIDIKEVKYEIANLVFVAIVELVVGLDSSVLVGLCVPHIGVFIPELIVETWVHWN